MPNYLQQLNELLVPDPVPKFRALDLFAGCGGLSLGFEANGILTDGIEMNPDAVATYNTNLAGKGVAKMLHTDDEYMPHSYDIVMGGPPCQPFSVGGQQKGIDDSRDGFPIFINAVQQIKPQIWMFENVRGLLYKNRWYLDLILSRLSSFGYQIAFHVLNASRYGVPQNRERFIAVGHSGNFRFPRPLGDSYTAGDAVSDLCFAITDDTKILTPSMDQYVAKYERASACTTPRDLHLDRPARTLTCRNLAGATGDMQRVRLPDGRRRRLTVREAARLQSFPDHFTFKGTETSQFNQIGNAVPPMLAYHLAAAMRSSLENQNLSREVMPNPIVYASSLF